MQESAKSTIGFIESAISTTYPNDKEEKSEMDEYSFRRENDGQTKILIVDDEPKNIKTIEEMLAPDAYLFLAAGCGKDALDKAYSESPDLILLDDVMPEMNGVKVAGVLKEDSRTKDIPIILITELEGIKTRNLVSEAEVDDFVIKPIRAADLRARVKSMFRLRQYRDQLLIGTHFESLQDKGVIEPASAQIRPEKDVPVVLLVEDNQVDAEIVQRFLKDEPVRLVVAKTGEEALARIMSESVDLVLLDLLLPDMNGFEIFQTLKENENSRDTPIIIITSLSNLESKIMGLELGSDDFLVKPIVKAILLARIRGLLHKKARLDRLRSHYEDALKIATIDWLTGLYNHGHFKKFLELEIKRSLRQTYPIGLIILDVDDFKRYNDRLGHSAGDLILQEIGRAVRDAIRGIDLAARYGGDEFAIVLPYSDSRGAVRAAERIQQSIGSLEFAPAKDQGLAKTTTSIGIAAYPEDASTTEDLIMKADRMLYLAKKNGKNLLCVYGRDPVERP